MKCQGCNEDINESYNLCPYCGVVINKGQVSDTLNDNDKNKNDNNINRINIYFKMIICSLFLICYRGFYLIRGGTAVLNELFIPDIVDYMIADALLIVSIAGSIIFFVCIVCFYKECARYLKKK